MPYTTFAVNLMKQLSESNVTTTQLNDLKIEECTTEQLTEIIEILSQLNLISEVRVLDLQKNFMRIIPHNIGKMANLTVLDISQNWLERLPESLTELCLLEELVCNQNYLQNLTIDFKKFPRLMRLNLAQNQLTTFPSSFYYMSRLTYLILNVNKIDELPESFNQLTSLVSLHLAYNKLKRIPPIPKLTSLRNLCVTSNKIEELPVNIGELKQLTYLSVGSNKLKAIPDSITQLTALVNLALTFNQLNTVPNLRPLTQLNSLTLNNNKLQFLPEGLNQLTNLQLIDVSDNQMITLPANFFKVSRFPRFYFGKNQFESLPETKEALEFFKGCTTLPLISQFRKKGIDNTAANYSKKRHRVMVEMINFILLLSQFNRQGPCRLSSLTMGIVIDYLLCAKLHSTSFDAFPYRQGTAQHFTQLFFDNPRNISNRKINEWIRPNKKGVMTTDELTANTQALIEDLHEATYAAMKN